MIVFDTCAMMWEQSVQSSNSDCGAAIYLGKCLYDSTVWCHFPQIMWCVASETFDLLWRKPSSCTLLPMALTDQLEGRRVVVSCVEKAAAGDERQLIQSFPSMWAGPSLHQARRQAVGRHWWLESLAPAHPRGGCQWGRWADWLDMGCCYGLNCVLPNPTPGPQDVTVCGDGAFKEVTEVEWGL